MAKQDPTATPSADADRRGFLIAAGRFAAVVPPTMTLLLSTSMTSKAIAASAASAAVNRVNAGVPSIPGDPGGPGGGYGSRGGPGGAPTPLQGASGVASGNPSIEPTGQSLVASSPDFDPPPVIPAKVANAGERG